MTRFSYSLILASAALTLIIPAGCRVGEVIGNAYEQEYLYDTFQTLDTPYQLVGSTSKLASRKTTDRVHVPAKPWKKTKATFYGGKYDDGKRRVCADSKTVYKSDGMFCATRLVPIGTVIEVKRGDVILRLVVADTQAKRYGHLIDIPSKTWDKLGAKRSVGMLPVEWRVL